MGISSYFFFIFDGFRDISCQKELWTGWAGSVYFLNDSDSSKMIMKMYFNFFPICFKGLKLFEFHRGDPYITANRNFVRFAHS